MKTRLIMTRSQLLVTGREGGGRVGDRRRRGAALLIVMVVVGLAAVLGFAMVSASGLQAQTAGNLRYVTAAEYLADSGVQLAMRYLQYPETSPVAMPSGYYPGQNGITFGAGVAGSADVQVTYSSATGLYTVQSVGKATTGSGGVVTKTAVATVAVVRHFQQTCAVQTASSIRLTSSTTVVGGLRTNATLTAPVGSAVSGTARFRLFSGSTAAVPNRSPLTGSEAVAAPVFATIKDYRGQYEYNGRTYTAQKLTTDRLSNVTLPTVADQVTNPAGVYWYDGSVLLNGNVRINGTLYLTQGSLYAGNTSNVVAPKAGFPAAVVPGRVRMVSNASLTADGLFWVGGGIEQYSSSGTSDSNASSSLLNVVNDLLAGILSLLGLGSPPAPGPIVVNGALLPTGATPIEVGYRGPITVSYDASKVAVPDFSTTNAVTMGVRVVSWEMN